MDTHSSWNLGEGLLEELLKGCGEATGIRAGKVSNPAQWALWDKRQSWLLVFPELSFIRQKVKPTHKTIIPLFR